MWWPISGISLKLETSLGTPVDLTLTQTLSLLINNFDLVRSWSGGSWLRESWEDSHYIGNCTEALGIKCQYLGNYSTKTHLDDITALTDGCVEINFLHQDTSSKFNVSCLCHILYNRCQQNFFFYSRPKYSYLNIRIGCSPNDLWWSANWLHKAEPELCVFVPYLYDSDSSKLKMLKIFNFVPK